MSTVIFNKRIYNPRTFTADVINIFDNMDALRRAARSGRVSRAFAEKIMMVVTSVNGCRYCSYGHSRAALAAGISETELQKLMALDLGAFPETEVIALTFAQHYAESHCNPDPAVAADDILLRGKNCQRHHDLPAHDHLRKLAWKYIRRSAQPLSWQTRTQQHFLERINGALGSHMDAAFQIIPADIQI